MNRSTLTLALLLSLASGAACAQTPIDETRPLDADARLSVANVKGRITVTAWDRNEVRVQGHVGEGTEGLEISGTAGNLSVKVKYPENGGGWFGGWGGNDAGDSELRVSAPAGVTLKVEAVSAEVEVTGIRGAELAIDNVSGDVTVDSQARDVDVNTVSGDQHLTLHSNDVSAESVSGDVEITGELGGRIDLEAVSGTLRVDSNSAAKSLTAGVVSGDVRLRTGLQPGGRLRAESLSGDLDVVLPAATSASLSASSFTGTIKSFAGTVETEEHGPGSSLDAKLGGGDGSIELETFSGDLTVRSE
jgi:hypothetical protein